MTKTNLYIIISTLILILITIISGYFTNTVFIYIISIYGIITFLKLFFEIFYSHINIKVNTPTLDNNFHSSVSVVVPSYNENYNILYACIKSILNQNYKGKLEVFLVNDGSENNSAELVSKKLSHKIHFISYKNNKGKRYAHKMAFDLVKGDIIVTVDSDTILHPNAIKNIIQNFKDKNTSAVTGNVKVLNHTKNLLTKLIDTRYWFAFNIERSAHSLFGVVMCCSGVFSAYRKDVIDKIKERYVKQRFMGSLCHYGDDRHLTNLVLTMGYKVYYNVSAIAYTIVPNKFSHWIKQQVRWNKSFYREILWNIPALTKHHLYMTIELILNTLLPLFLILNIGLLFYKSFSISWLYFLLFIELVLISALVRIDYAIYITKKPKFLYFILYTFLHVIFLIPVRIYALATLSIPKWGTRC